MTTPREPSAAPPEHSIRALLQRIALVPGKLDRPVTGLADDSRQVQPGDLFIARAGRQTHGGDHLEQALERGAAAALVEIDGPVVKHTLRYGPPVIGVPGLSAEIGTIASRFYGQPSTRMEVIGVTGTNGKSSVLKLLGEVLDDPAGGQRCGVLGTLGYGFPDALQPATHTTPGPLVLQAWLSRLLAQGAKRVVMEVSSHALDQYRVDGVAFHAAVFTNLSHDHLDYHGDIGSYGQAKRRLFMFPGLRWAVINSDDAFGRKLIADPPGTAPVISYGVDHHPRPMVTPTEIRLDRGIDLKLTSPWGKGELHSPLLGRVNVANLLAAVATLGCVGMPLQQALQRLARVERIDGRLETVGGGDGKRPRVLVDYAHTPDALEQVLQALRDHCSGKLWCVFGCGGERDRDKRALMGDIAERYADRVVVTWDNPRHEEPGYIIGQILGGMDQPTAVHVDRDRAAAIGYAIAQADPQDLVLIAGKGHEDYQQVGDQRLPFSDRRCARDALEARDD